MTFHQPNEGSILVARHFQTNSFLFFSCLFLFFSSLFLSFPFSSRFLLFSFLQVGKEKRKEKKRNRKENKRKERLFGPLSSVITPSKPASQPSTGKPASPVQQKAFLHAVSTACRPSSPVPRRAPANHRLRLPAPPARASHLPAATHAPPPATPRQPAADPTAARAQTRPACAPAPLTATAATTTATLATVATVLQGCSRCSLEAWCCCQV